MNTWLSRILSWVAAALVGGVYGVAGTIAHSLTWGAVPVGLIIAAIACGALLVAIRALTHDRGATLAAGLGMLGMVTLISGVGPGGSVVVADGVWGRIWIYLVAGLVLLAVAWPRFSRPATGRPAPAAAGAPAPSGAPDVITAVPGVREEPAGHGS
ncbi:histidinol dehydrogenase [Microbacterium sp. CIAB417]|uniref:histidinol dehydrogenase n=1 Tax=Microbacterium sp. CIAB417 TaxID=2860287 RepID=UPI001FAB4C25|nr:histidinol dehydrogenase [Microbacterium sp. CIAB417]